MADTRCNRRAFVLSSAAVAGAGLVAGCAGNGSPALANSPGGAPITTAMLGDPDARQGQFAEVNGARIFYQVSGTGPAMMLLHGYPLSGALFTRVRDQLAQRFRVITLDHRGYGKSEAPGTPSDIATYAQDALALMQQLGIGRAHIGGMSMGGPILFEMFSRAPERFEGVMLIDTIAAPANPAEAGLWRGVAEMIRSGGMDAVIPVLMKEMLTGEARTQQPEQVRYLEAIIKNASRDAGIGGALALATRPDYQQLLGRINVPALVLVGLQDSVYPVAIAQRMQQMIPGAQLAIIDNASHAAVFERGDEFARRVLDFHSAM